MNIERKIKAFELLGTEILGELNANSDLDLAIEQAGVVNPWFTKNFVKNAMHSIATSWLNKTALSDWISAYRVADLNPSSPKNIGVVMAGNIPLVGFHDLLCVLASGNRFVGKFSSKDSCLMQAIIKMLLEIEPEFNYFIQVAENQLKTFDAVIATGSNSTSKYFEYYFKNVPSIIRKHRNSIAILTGNETPEDFSQLSNDIFLYFGLGCRNVSKIFVPKGYDLIPLLDSLSGWSYLINHNKYANNYEYSRAMFAMNQVKHLDTGFLLITESEQIESSVGVLNYQQYSDIAEVNEYINRYSDRIQCVVGRSGACTAEIPFGMAQNPAITDYADGIDTIKFLSDINSHF